MSKHDPANPDSGLQWLDPREAEADQVLDRLLAEAAERIPGLSPDQNLTDPLVKLLLAAVAKEYAAVYSQLDQVIDVAYQQLVDNLLTFPHAPHPSSLVLALDVTDAGTPVDENLIVIGRKALPDGDTFTERNIHFAPFGAERVAGIPAPMVIHQAAGGTLSLHSNGTATPVGTVEPGPGDWLHIGITASAGLELETIALFLHADDPALVDALRWSRWYTGAPADDTGFVPAENSRQVPWNGHDDPPVMRSRSDGHRPTSPHDRAFVDIPTEALRRRSAPLPEAVEVAAATGALGEEIPHSWLRVRCHERLDVARLPLLQVLPNCVVAFNLQAATARFKIGRAPIEFVTLPVGYDGVFRLDEVRDAANVTEFLDAEAGAGLGAEAVYHLDRTPDDLLRLRLMSRSEPTRPRAVEVMYTTTSGVEANGLAAGSVDTIYNRRLAPGVAGAVSITGSAGGRAAPDRTWLTTELRAQLATRGRAVTPRDFEVLARAFDPVRISKTEVDRGVMRGPRGITSCVRVTAHYAADQIHGDLERDLLQQQLQQYLAARAPADLAVAVDIVESTGVL